VAIEGVVTTSVLGDALTRIREDVDKHFDLLLPVPDDARARLFQAMRHAAIGGGKRLRPLLLVATAGMFGVERDAAVRTGCAVEAIHAYSLIHDDLPCMDDDAMRHGRPTVHLAFDEATAVLAGDALHALAFDILVSPQVTSDPFVRCELVLTLAKASGMDGMAGGTLVVTYAASPFARPIRNLMLLATPVDFNHMDLFQTWADRRYFDVDLLIRELELIPPEIMLGAFDLARPANRPAGRATLWNNMWNDDFVKSYRMFDRWAAETLPIPGAYFGTLVKRLMWENALVAGTLEVCGETVDLGRIDAAILNVVARHDHVVAHEATAPLMTMTSSTDREEIIAKGGHVSLVAGPAALKRLWPLVDQWLAPRSV